jgi:hypothetical protein
MEQCDLYFTPRLILVFGNPVSEGNLSLQLKFVKALDITWSLPPESICYVQSAMSDPGILV